MKKLFTLAAFLFIIAISSSALAANWVRVARNDDYGGKTYVDYYVDKDSIRRATNSKFSQPNAVLAVVKQISNKGHVKENIMGFWREDGKKYFAYPTSYLDGSDGVYNNMEVNRSWSIVWDYVYNNLP
ncbi:MAG: hypothetical protein IJK81_02605 [Selenomonadaceae bacterium]|nr:hypothetical protein [Selenomonadaceae bacterium]